jgi:GT2 family glycosyltransferase
LEAVPCHSFLINERRNPIEAVSIILKVWNAPRYVKLCLETLLQNTTSPFELILVDNGSKPKLHQFLTQLVENDSRLRLITNPTNQGPGFANRQGAALASHRFLCLMDSDILVPPGWLERLLADFLTHPEFKLLAPLQPGEEVAYPFAGEHPGSRQVWYEVKRRYPHAEPLEQLAVYTHGLSLAGFEREIQKANPAGIRLTQAPPDFVSTCCLLVDRDFVQQAGGIADPAFTSYGSEDVDLCWRVGIAGGKVGKTASVYIHHFLGASLEANSLDRPAALERANTLLYEKWREYLLALVVQHANQGTDHLIAYLEQHFIFSALARNTHWTDDLRLALKNPDLPDDIQWRPAPPD